MKTTVELPDAIYRQAEAAAALRGRKLNDLIEEGLRLVLESLPLAPPGRSLSDLMQDVCGIFESGVDDLGSNPEHLKGYGCDVGHRL